MEEICCNTFTCVYMKGICSHEGINFTSQKRLSHGGKQTEKNWRKLRIMMQFLQYCVIVVSSPHHKKHILYFYDQTPTATIFCCWFLCGCHSRAAPIFKGGIYFLEKPADINNGWIRHVKTIQGWRCQYSSQSHWVLLSAVEMRRTTRTARALAW